MKYSFRLTEEEDQKFIDLIELAKELKILSNYGTTAIVKAGLISLNRELLKRQKEAEEKRKEELIKHHHANV